jgi:hypothetical protein
MVKKGDWIYLDIGTLFHVTSITGLFKVLSAESSDRYSDTQVIRIQMKHSVQSLYGSFTPLTKAQIKLYKVLFAE